MFGHRILLGAAAVKFGELRLYALAAARLGNSLHEDRPPVGKSSVDQTGCRANGVGYILRSRLAAIECPFAVYLSGSARAFAGCKLLFLCNALK